MRRPYTKPSLIKVDTNGVHGKRILAQLDSPRHPNEYVKLQTAVRVHMSTPDGTLLRHDGFTSAVSNRRCLLTMEIKPHVGQRMVLVNPTSRAEQTGTVAQVEKVADGGYQVVFEFDNLSSQLWFT